MASCAYITEVTTYVLTPNVPHTSVDLPNIEDNKHTKTYYLQSSGCQSVTGVQKILHAEVLHKDTTMHSMTHVSKVAMTQNSSDFDGHMLYF